MKICHITIENFRTLDNFDSDIGKHNLFVGQNNTGKSNLLWAINCFYNHKKISINDITKDSKGNPIANELKITVTFDNLTEIEQKKNEKYYHDGILKISLIGYLDKDQNFKIKHHGYIKSEKLEFPIDFNKELKKLILSEKVPTRASVDNFPSLSLLLSKIQPRNKIKTENWQKIIEIFLNEQEEIKRKPIEIQSPTEYQGFVGVRKHETTGECILIPAEKDPSEDLNTNRANTPVNHLVDYLIRDIESKEIQETFQDFHALLTKESDEKTKSLQERFNQELEVWQTTVTINQRPFELSDTIPSNIEILFDDGVLTNLERKGTGLQRYVFFKFLKISHELQLGQLTSLILLFEEPEAHLHPQIQREIAKILRKLSVDETLTIQTFITTHSSQFIDILNLDNVFIFRKAGSCTEYSKCKINLESIKEEIKTALFFNPHVNEIFFADRILLVEGQSEEITMNFLIQEELLDIKNVSMISAKSKYNIPTFLNILNAIQIPYSVLVDEDPYFPPHYTNKDPSAIKGRKKAYNLTKKIADLIDNELGTLMVLSPDFEGFLGVSKSYPKKSGKPLVIYKYLKEIKVSNVVKFKEIIELFNELINPSFTNKKVNDKGSKWIYQNENDVNLPETNFED